MRWWHEDECGQEINGSHDNFRIRLHYSKRTAIIKHCQLNSNDFKRLMNSSGENQDLGVGRSKSISRVEHQTLKCYFVGDTRTGQQLRIHNNDTCKTIYLQTAHLWRISKSEALESRIRDSKLSTTNEFQYSNAFTTLFNWDFSNIALERGSEDIINTSCRTISNTSGWDIPIYNVGLHYNVLYICRRQRSPLTNNFHTAQRESKSSVERINGHFPLR